MHDSFTLYVVSFHYFGFPSVFPKRFGQCKQNLYNLTLYVKDMLKSSASILNYVVYSVTYLGELHGVVNAVSLFAARKKTRH